MNIPLYYSSAIIGTLIIIISLVLYNPQLTLLYQITYLGIISSILNHMDTNTAVKYADRFIIVLAIIIYAYYTFFSKSKSIQLLVFILLSIAILCYLVSKITTSITDIHLLGLPDYIPKVSQNLHIASHCLVLFMFIIIIFAYTRQTLIPQ
uniref:Uncharacterized protein n=1 Tax=viral metagenome TaxID=1070528 RepID=A0A6C0HJC7_9ZZZZ